MRFTGFILSMVVGFALVSPAEATVYRIVSAAAYGEETRADNKNLTLRQLATARLDSDDVIELACGAVLREPLILPPNPPAGLIVRAEHGCSAAQRPTLRLTGLVNGWREEGAGVYVTDVDFMVHQLFVDGVKLAAASFPASVHAIAEKGEAADSGRSGSRWLEDEAIKSLAGRSLDGAQVHMRTTPWSIEARSVLRQEAGRLIFDSPTRFPVRKNVRYTLSGKPWMLEQGPGWAWVRGERRLYVRLPDGGHPGQRVEATRYETGLHATWASNLSVSGLRIIGSGGDGLRCDKCQQIKLSDIEILDAGRDGVGLEKVNDLRISGLLILRAARDGLNLLQSQRGEVSENRLEDIGNGGWPQSSGAAINAGKSSKLNIHHNRIRRTGYIGITFGRLSRVANNVVRDVCLVLDDCGAIYSWANTDPRPLNSVVTGNIIENVVGNRTGSPEPWTLAAGIYLDDLTNGVVVDGNTVSSTERGIYLHNAFDNLIQNNTVMDSRAYSLALMNDHPAYPAAGLHANRVRANTLVSMNRTPFIYYLDRMGRNFNDALDANVYLGQTDEKRFVMHRQGSFGNVVNTYAGSVFRKLPGVTKHGTFKQVSRPPLVLINDGPAIREYNCPFDSPEVCVRMENPSGENITWPVRVPPFGSLILVNG